MRIGRCLEALVSLGLAYGVLIASPVNAQSIADFYAGRSINVYIGFTPGGAYDIYARQLARVKKCTTSKIAVNVPRNACEFAIPLSSNPLLPFSSSTRTDNAPRGTRQRPVRRIF